MALTSEQKTMRRTGVTASEIAAICGLNPWKSPGDIWAEKLGLKEEWAGNEDTERGNELERALVSWTGRRLQRLATFNVETYRSKKEELALATPDGFLLADEPRESPKPIATVEVKAPSWRTAKDWEDPSQDPEGCPKYYLTQAMWQAGVLELPEAIVSGLVDGRLWVYRLPFSEELYQAMLSKAKAFWGYVEAKEPPPVEPGQSTDWVGQVYREQVDKDLIEPPQEARQDAIHAAQTYLVAREQMSRAKLDMEASKGYLCALIEQHQGLSLQGWKCTWKQGSPKKEVDWEGIALKAMGNLAGIVPELEMDKWIVKHTKMKPGFRTFNLKEE